MGRIAQSLAMGLVRGCLVKVAVTVYVLGVFAIFFLIPLAWMSRTPGADGTEIFLPFGVGGFFLLVLPALVAWLAVRLRNARFDAVFGGLGLTGFPYALQYRRYDGAWRGRRLQVFVSRGPCLVLEVETPVATRLGITAGSGDTRFLAELSGQGPLRLESPGLVGLDVFAPEEAWAKRLLAEPAVPALLDRLLRFEGPLARRQLVLRPGALALTFHLTTALAGWLPSTAQAREWAEALVSLAAIAERMPPPDVPLAPSRLEQHVGSVRGLRPALNPGAVALVTMLVTALVIAAMAAVIVVVQRSCRPVRSLESSARSPQTAARPGLPGALSGRVKRAGTPACPISFEDAGPLHLGESRSCVCPHLGTSGTIRGSGRYHPSSWICDAARHAGVLRSPGDVVTFTRQAECPRLWGSRSNGQLSLNHGAPTPTFSFAAEPPPCPPPPSTAADLAPCPASGRNGLDAMPVGSSFDCTCAYNGVVSGRLLKGNRGVAWGTNVYAAFSDVCDAAQHAGAVDHAGSTVTVFLGGTCDRFFGTNRFGIGSENWSRPARSLAFQQPFPACPTGPW